MNSHVATSITGFWWRSIAASLAAAALLVWAESAAAPRVAGADYFGQKPPGEVPELFAPGLVSTEADESAPAFSPDGREFYFSRAEERGRREIFVGLRQDVRWTRPRPVSFSTSRFDDSKATLADDGRTMVFASNRPVPFLVAGPPNFLNLWISTRDAEGWTEPRPLGPEVNTPWDEDFPYLSADGILWFASNRSGKPAEYRIYRSRGERGRFAAAVLFVSPIESGFGDAVCTMSRDRRRLVFMSMRPGGEGAIDLYVARRGAGASWERGINLGRPVNSPDVDWFATLTPDGRYLFFASRRSGNGDIYWVDAKVLERAQAAGRARR